MAGEISRRGLFATLSGAAVAAGVPHQRTVKAGDYPLYRVSGVMPQDGSWKLAPNKIWRVANAV